jgi:hypothetical protein
VGLKGSSQLVLKFADADAFGFQCGKANRITLIDIDSRDERIVGEAIKLFGEPPILWRTGSGNHAMPFRHNGEGRRIRPLPGLPIDVLGGGYAVAPPSRGAKAHYKFLQGSLADFDRLPVARIEEGRSLAQTRDTRDRIAEGKRDDTLFHYALEQASHVYDLDALLDVVRTRNLDCDPPLPDAVVVAKAQTAWRYQQEGRNLVGRGRALVMSHEIYDVLWNEDRDALALYWHLRRFHWGREFVLAKAMAAAMGWGLPKWKEARDALRRLGSFAASIPAGTDRMIPQYMLGPRGAVHYPNKK